MPYLLAEDLTEQFSYQKVFFQVQGACSIKIVILLAAALPINLNSEFNRNQMDKKVTGMALSSSTLMFYREINEIDIGHLSTICT